MRSALRKIGLDQAKIRFAWAAGLLAIAYLHPLSSLVSFALHSTLYSYIVLIPLISGYLIWLKRDSWRTASGRDQLVASVMISAGVIFLALYGWAIRSGTRLEAEDSLALTTLSFVFLLVGLVALCFDRAVLRSCAFPLAFLVLFAPLPVAVTDGIEAGLQYTSAAAAHVLFVSVGTPVFAQGLIFQLSDIALEVAPQCSGIHSTLALFITSLLAGYMFLRSPWRRAILCAAVIPLAIVRNGFRIFTIGELCVHVGPQMIDSWVHHHGGPLFFILSLIPFFALVAYLIKSEPRVLPASAAATSLPL